MTAPASKAPSLVRVYGDDWEGLYVDGKLFCEGHSLRPIDVAEALGVRIESMPAGEGWLEDGNLPKALSDARRPKR